MSKVKLSLCMIAKNEEMSIEKALDCVKNVAFERIVVDTGSADRTIEVAERNGAKVYRFQWINDFSAAKNFAIEQATGNWIVALDADEYFSYEDADKLKNFLEQIESEPGKWENCLAISVMLVNIDDNGRPMTKSSIVRAFRNKPSIRYKGRIHEQLSIDVSNIQHIDDITLIHTGYAESVHRETGKAKRNVGLLREELKKDPNNLNLKAYLANSLSISGDEKDSLEAEELITEIIRNGSSKSVNNILKIKMYIYMINRLLSNKEKQHECEDMCRKALSDFPDSIDFEYFLANALSSKGEHVKAWELLKSCESKLLNDPSPEDSIMIPADPTILFSRMIIAAKELGDIENVILYSTHVLSMDKTRLSVLSPCIATLLHYGVTEEETIDLLSNIYDFSDKDDLNIVSNAANSCGAIDFVEKLEAMQS